MEKLIVQPAYLWAFETNRWQITLLKKQIPQPQPIYDIFFSKKERIDLLRKANLSVILAKKLVGNIGNSQKHALQILSRQHYFDKKEIKCCSTIKIDTYCFSVVVFHPTDPSPCIATGSGDGKINFWSISENSFSKKPIVTLKAHRDMITAIVFHPFAPIFVSSSNDNTLKLWRIPDLVCLQTLKHTNSVESIAFNNSGTILASSSYDYTTKLWKLSEDYSSFTCFATLPDNLWNNSVSFHPTAPIVAISCTTSIKLWRISSDESSATCIANLSEHNTNIYTVAFHPKLPILATGSCDKTIKLWRILGEKQSDKCLTTLVGHQHIINAITFHPTALIMASGSFDTTVKLWRLSPNFSSGTCIASFQLNDRNSRPYPITSIAFHPKDLSFATSCDDGTVRLWK